MWIAAPYGGDVSTDRHQTERHSISVDKELWDAYGEVVGERGRAEDIRQYLTWRVENPRVPLPGRFRGPRRSQKRDS